jgi:predicted  nucleic acid-binding Zn-ribbon protein
LVFDICYKGKRAYSSAVELPAHNRQVPGSNPGRPILPRGKDVDLDNLIHLQNLDKKMADISLSLDNIPSQIEKINEKIENNSKIVAQAKEKMVQNQKKRRDLETEVKDIKVRISKYNLQLNEVKTNKEYSSLLKEIEEAKKKVDGLEEKIITEMLAADQIEEEIKTADKKYKEGQERFLKEKNALQQKRNELEEKRKKLIQEKDELLPKIPAEQVSLYLKISPKKNGVALSPVFDDFCSMCHVRIRPQVLNELKGQEKVIVCENCGRILYWLKKETSHSL